MAAFLQTVEQKPLMRQKTFAPSMERNEPEIFCCTFIMRRSRSAWLLSKRAHGSVAKRRMSALWSPRHSASNHSSLCLIRPFVVQFARWQHKPRGYSFQHEPRCLDECWIVRELVGGGNMNPLCFPVYPRSSLVGKQFARFAQAFFDCHVGFLGSGKGAGKHIARVFRWKATRRRVLPTPQPCVRVATRPYFVYE